MKPAQHATALLLFAATFLYVPSAHADCWQQCEEQCAPTASGSASTRECVRRCSHSCANLNGASNGGSGGSNSERYGAIAISTDTLEYGIAFGFPNVDSAQNAALKDCANKPHNPTDCDIDIWFYNQCSALVMYNPPHYGDEGWWGSAFSNTREDAIRIATERCNSIGPNCKLVGSYCSY